MSAALAHLLGTLQARIPPQHIDRIWLFPPRQLRGRESGLAVLALYEDEAGELDRRRLLTLRYQVEPGRGGVRIQQELVEQGSAPTARIARVVAGVLRRLDSAGETPAAVPIGGDAERWQRMLADLNLEHASSQ